MKKLKLGELFAGYGGLGMAVEQVFDAELAWYAEFDDAPSKIMEHHWPGVPNHRDVTTVDWSQVEPVDIISGGSPCQDLSAAGRRKGMTEGTRSNLWVSMREAIATIKPTYVVWENVRGAFSAKATSEMESCPGCVGADGGQTSLFCGHLDVYSETFTTSGTMRNGVAYELPTWEHHTAGSGSLSSQPGGTLFRTPCAAETAGGPRDPNRPGATMRLSDQVREETESGELAPLLPTPMANEAEKAWVGTRESKGQKYLSHVIGEQLLPTPEAKLGSSGPDYARANRKGSGGHDLTTAVHLLPTPNTMDMLPARDGEAMERQLRRGEGKNASRRTSMGNLREDIMLTVDPEVFSPKLLPTPRATDGTKGGPNQRGSSGDLMLPSAVHTPAWGKYEPAIRRWESCRGAAPAPTELNAKGKHRLAAAFGEWLMGLDPGHVTDVPGISRNEQLKALGNGVVPQQAVAALRDMIRF